MVKRTLGTFKRPVLCIFSMGFDSPMWAFLAPTVHFFEHDVWYRSVGAEQLNATPAHVRPRAHVHAADLGANATVPLASATCNVTVVDSSLGYLGGYHRQRAMKEAARITSPGGTIFLDDANRPDENIQLRRYCRSTQIAAVRNGFARCTPRFLSGPRG
jgi:SAM-dependent methyltransferase